jgi:hypothetical protein
MCDYAKNEEDIESFKTTFYLAKVHCDLRREF